jgi:hypothetical protein
VASTAVVYSFQVADLHNQLVNAQSAKLSNINLGYEDEGAGVIHVSGYVFNSGTATARDCYIIVGLYKAGARTNSTRINLDDINGQTSVFIDKNVTYSGLPPTNVTLNLEWLKSWSPLLA